MDLSAIRWYAVLTAAFSSFVIGADATLWFAILAAASVGIFWVAPSLGVILGAWR